MQHLNIKKLTFCLTLAIAASNASLADTIAVDASLNAQVNNQTKKQSVNSSPSKPSIMSCPSDFQQVKISDDARQCQAFDESKTAVMVYHSPRSPSELLNVYQTVHPALKTHTPVSGRTLLSSEDKGVRVIISPDNTGSQVDILVTSTTK